MRTVRGGAMKTRLPVPSGLPATSCKRAGYRSDHRVFGARLHVALSYGLIQDCRRDPVTFGTTAVQGIEHTVP